MRRVARRSSKHDEGDHEVNVTSLILSGRIPGNCHCNVLLNYVYNLNPINYHCLCLVGGRVHFVLEFNFTWTREELFRRHGVFCHSVSPNYSFDAYFSTNFNVYRGL